MENSLVLMKATDSAANVTALNIGIGGRVFMGKERDTLWALVKEPTSSVPTAMTPMSQNLNR